MKTLKETNRIVEALDDAIRKVAAPIVKANNLNDMEFEDMLAHFSKNLTTWIRGSV